MITPLGQSLTTRDLRSLAARWIDLDTARRQHLRRVASLEAGEILGRNGPGDYSGLLIPYIWPGDDYIREYRLRRDHPDIENGKPRLKYLSPPGRGNLLYFPMGTEWERAARGTNGDLFPWGNELDATKANLPRQPHPPRA